MVSRDAVAARLGAGMAATALAALVLFLCWGQVGNGGAFRPDCLLVSGALLPLDQNLTCHTPTTAYVSTH